MKNVFLFSLLFVFFVPVQVFSYTDKEWCDSLPPYYYGNSYYDADKDKPYCLLVCGASFKMQVKVYVTDSDDTFVCYDPLFTKAYLHSTCSERLREVCSVAPDSDQKCDCPAQPLGDIDDSEPKFNDAR